MSRRRPQGVPAGNAGSTDSQKLVLDAASPGDAAVLANLLELYVHDLSETFPVELGVYPSGLGVFPEDLGELPDDLGAHPIDLGGHPRGPRTFGDGADGSWMNCGVPGFRVDGPDSGAEGPFIHSKD